MNKKPSLIQRHLSTFSFLVFYILLIIGHLIMDGLVLSIQFEMLITILPFMLIGIILDYVLRHDSNLHQIFKVFAQLIPISLILLIVVSGLFNNTTFNGQSLTDMLNYTYWLFIGLPFFMASYDKQHKKPLIFSTIGIIVLAIVYFYLTMSTYKLIVGGQAILHFLALFFILYSASTIKKIPFLGLILGGLKGIALLIIRFKPASPSDFFIAWDRNIAVQFEMLTLITFILCILIRFIAAIYNSKETNK